MNIFYCGTIEKRKNLKFLLKAIKKNPVVNLSLCRKKKLFKGN